MDCCRTAAHSRVAPKDSGEGQPFQWVEFQVVDLVINVAWREMWPGGKTYTGFWAVAHASPDWSGDLQEQNEEIRDKDFWVRDK